MEDRRRGGGGGKAPASGKAQHKTPASALEIRDKGWGKYGSVMGQHSLVEILQRDS